ncbi:MAG: enoyl-CoA hydratase/isomerase family protein [Candidatus Lambdaproteobacteria bacterium]|nr:enoyl-CoA hydratase/isomerase family protein [Candidatus Lambdaproteobacteria bacterium]
MSQDWTEQMIAETDGGIGWMIFNNPARHNAVSFEMWEAMPRIIERFVADPEVRVIVLKGAGERAFVAGADISQFEKKRGTADAIKVYNAATMEAYQRLEEAGKPTIAMVNGYCIGGGLAIAVGCDLRIAAEGSTFGIPAAKLGLGYDYGGVRKLVNLVGPSFTKEIFYTARTFNTDEALTMGLINRVQPWERLEAYVREYAQVISGNAPLTIRAVKTSVREALKDPEKRDMATVHEQIEACLSSSDYQEGRRAFMEKRPPRFQGR